MALKTQFLALHLGQTVVYTGKGRATNKLGAEAVLEADNLYLCAFLPQRALRLKALSGITNDEAEVICKIVGYTPSFNVMSFAIKVLSEWANEENGLTAWVWLNIFDYLRSRGYALPYAGYDVSDLIQLGWVQLQYDPQ